MFFKGLNLSQQPGASFYHNTRCIREVVDIFDLNGAKAAASPISTFVELKVKDGIALVDAKSYQQLVVSLQYLNFTCPDISYSVNKLSQFMENSTTAQW